MKIKELYQTNKLTISFEFFPPKTDDDLILLYKTIQDLKKLNPGFVSVTYGAGGSTRRLTLEIVSKIKNEIGIETMAHLTCVGHSKSEIKEILDNLKDNKIENILALRGDPPADTKKFVPLPDGFKYAGEVVEFIKNSYDFCIGVACYPEGHIESENKEVSLKNFVWKVNKGADFAITQLFFDNKDFFDFVSQTEKENITIPIIPGIMPITNLSQIEKFTSLCGARIPKDLLENLKKVKHNPSDIIEVGVEYATKQCEELIKNKVKGLHFYTLNKSLATVKILKNLKRMID